LANRRLIDSLLSRRGTYASARQLRGEAPPIGGSAAFPQIASSLYRTSPLQQRLLALMRVVLVLTIAMIGGLKRLTRWVGRLVMRRFGMRLRRLRWFGGVLGPLSQLSCLDF